MCMLWAVLMLLVFLFCCSVCDYCFLSLFVFRFSDRLWAYLLLVFVCCCVRFVGFVCYVCFACCVCHTSFIWFQVLRECNLDIRKWVVMQNLAVDLIFCCVICLFSRFKEGWLECGRRRLSEWWWADSDLHDLHWTTNKPNKYSRKIFYKQDWNHNILNTCIYKRRGKKINMVLSHKPYDNIYICAT